MKGRMTRKLTQKKNQRPERVFAFIDSQNLNLGSQKMGWKVDWAKFRKYLQDKYGVSRAYLFIGYVPEYEPMYEQLHEAGYLIVLKPTVELTQPHKHDNGHSEQKDDNGKESKPTIKGNIDVELVLYAMKEMPNYDKAIIVSGDGDFHALVEYLANKKRLLHLMTPNWQYSSLLKEFDDYIIRLDEHRRELAYRDRRTRKISKPKKAKTE